MMNNDRPDLNIYHGVPRQNLLEALLTGARWRNLHDLELAAEKEAEQSKADQDEWGSAGNVW